jgi:hypothetical protein
MNEEEIEWFEDNWEKGKPVLKRTTSNKEYKLINEPWHCWWDAPHEDSHYHGDKRCWKSKRKVHYHIPKPKKNKKRKSPEKEHWRYKRNCHTLYYLILSWEYERKKLRRRRGLE